MASARITVVALDPGITTGYAIGNIDIDEGFMEIVTGQERWTHAELWGFLGDYEPSYIVCERFEYRNKARKGLELYSRELIGVCNLYAQLYMGPPFEVVMQNAMKGTGSNYFSDDRLKKDKIYKPGRDHSNDAARHLLHWFKFGAGFQYNKKGYESAL